VALGSDDGEVVAVPEAVRQHLAKGGHEIVEPVPIGTAWPDVGRAVGEAVAGGGADVGIVCCWTGTGVSMAASKVPGVRAALCSDAETARGARRWNDANVLALSLRLTTPTVAVEIVGSFLDTEADDDERPNFERLE